MANSGPTAEFPLKDMPRMGRRNAVAYGALSDDDGAFSPIDLLHASESDIDPDGAIAQELQHERRGKGPKSNGAIAAAPMTSVLDGWKKLHEAQSGAYNGIERLFDPNAGSLRISRSVIEPKPKKSPRNNSKDAIISAENHRGNPVIPWRQQDVKPTTIAEERRKLFESFNMTSIEPPDTPQVSEQTLRKPKKNKRRKKDKNVQESRPSTSSNKPKDAAKDPYSNIQPKVNTRWSKLDELQQNLTPTNQNAPDSTDTGNKLKLSPDIDNPAAMKRTINGGEKPFLALPLKKQASNTESHKPKKLVNNYPASETVKNTTDKLPLTIAPRYNHKKAMGLTNELRSVKNRTDDSANDTTPSTNRLYGTIPAHQTGKQESQRFPKAATGSTLKSTFFNLQRINNVGTTPTNNTAVNNSKRTSSVNQLVVGRYSANILGTPVIGLTKKSIPILTTIQAPPSPFLTSKLSILSQMNEIPVKGEKVYPSNSKGSRSAAKVTKTQSRKTHATAPKSTHVAPPVPPPLPKVIPTLGPAPNKYNNIYIGPYSGSESEGENKGSSKKR